MEISFKSKKLRKCCEDFNEARRKFGRRQAEELFERMNELRSSEHLKMIKTIPQARLHDLHQNRQGQFAVDLIHPYRLIFKPDQKEEFEMNDWSTINGIKILEIEDYH